jgi:hypothetical protein
MDDGCWKWRIDHLQAIIKQGCIAYYDNIGCEFCIGEGRTEFRADPGRFSRRKDEGKGQRHRRLCLDT